LAHQIERATPGGQLVAHHLLTIANHNFVNTRNKLFEQCVQEIETSYIELGHRLGWRFLSVGKVVLNGPAEIALITLNPGGNEIPPDHPTASCESGVSYLVESWDGAPPGQSKLQKQVQGLFRLLVDTLRYHGTYQQLMVQTLIGYFVPFRSPRLADLARQRESIEFGHRLWRKLLPAISPKLIICLGRDVQAELRTLLPIATDSQLITSTTYPTGWGEYTAEIDEFQWNNNKTSLLYLPHLSTWTLFTSKKCIEHMPVIIRAACKNF
jgi:hypothetical protein